MKSFLISVLGDDKPGLVDGLSNIILSSEGDWIESRMSALKKVCWYLESNVPSKNAAKLKKALVSASLGLQIAWRRKQHL